MISVCLATYNGEAYLEEQLDSICSQLKAGDELIISDDGSDDRTIEIINSFGIEQLQLFRNNHHNPIKNFEFTLGKASKSIIALSDQDDIWEPGKLDLVRDQLSESKLTALLMNGRLIDEKGDFLGQTLFERLNTSSGYMRNLRVNTFMGSSMAFTRDLLDYVLPFPHKIAMHDWWIGLLAEKIGTVILSDELTIRYRIHGTNSSLGGSSMSDKFLWRWNMHRAIVKRLGEKKRSR